MLEKTFGVKLKDKEYRDRIGAYAVIPDKNGNVCTVKACKGNFLIGGGIEEGESHLECIKRECLEETGFDIEVRDFICKGDIFFYSDLLDCYLHQIGHYYFAELKNKLQEPTEENHTLEWIRVNEVENKMFLENQIWAVNEAIRLQNISKLDSRLFGNSMINKRCR